MNSKFYQDDHELLQLMKRELFSAVIGDVLDKMGRLHQFLPPKIKPLRPDMVVAGRAMTVLEADVFIEIVEDGKGPLSHKPFGLMFEALDDLKPGEIYVASGAGGRYALWGELMSTRAALLGAAGAVLNGFSRDTSGILKLDFPTFSKGGYGQDQGARGKVIDWRVPIEMDNVRIEPGALIFGDRDGAVTIPKDVEEEVIAAALDKVRGEKKVAQAIRQGMSAVEAFETYGIM